MLPWNPPPSSNVHHQQDNHFNSNNGQQQQQQPQQGQQPGQQGQAQQQQQQQPQYQPISLSSVLHFLQTEHRRYAKDRNEWEIERAEMRARIALLEGEKRGNEGAMRNQNKLVKALESALRVEREKNKATSLSVAHQQLQQSQSQASPSPSGTSSPIHIPPTSTSASASNTIAPNSKLAPPDSSSNPAISIAAPAPINPASTQSHSSILPNPALNSAAAATQPPTSRASSSLGINGTTSSWAAAGGPPGARDPRGRARSRDYLKQCLQEITYLTSQTTLNPLAPASNAAPNINRPRKVLPDLPPPSSSAHPSLPNQPGLINLPGPISSNTSSSVDHSQGAQGGSSAAAAAITNFPSDPASAFVPLRRQVSQPIPSVSGAAPSSTIPAGASATTNSLASAAPHPPPGAALPPPPSLSLPAAPPSIPALPLPPSTTSPTSPAPSKPTPLLPEEDKSSNSEADFSSSFSFDGSTRSLLPPPTTPALTHSNSGSGSGSLGSRTDSDANPTFTSAAGNSSSPTDVPSSKSDGENDPIGGRKGGRDSDLDLDGEQQQSLDSRGRGSRDCVNRDLVPGQEGEREQGEGEEQAKLREGGRRREGGGERNVQIRGGSGGGAAAARLTAIFQPGSDEEWREQLRVANEEAEREEKDRDLTGMGVGNGNGGTLNSNTWDDEERQLENLKWEDDDELSGSGANDGTVDTVSGPGKVWEAKRTLRSHLESVRTIAFGQQDFTLASGSDDMTVKIWRLNPQTFGAVNGRGPSEAEPIVSFRLHIAPVTSVIISNPQSRVYSASLDKTIGVWTLPSRHHSTYSPYDPSYHLGTLIGHTDGVWALVLVGDPDDGLLCSASADGTVKIWDTTKVNLENEEPLVRSWDYGDFSNDNIPSSNGATKKKNRAQVRPAPTAVAAVGIDRVAVAFQNSVVKVFELASGREILKLKSDQTFDGTPGTQINHLVAHPTMPILVTCHEDKFIRTFDSDTGECKGSMIAHLDGVASIDIDPTGKNLASVGHDTSLRFWDLETLTCVREISAHRAKRAEGILDIKFHQTLPFLATAGADGTIKVWG
ncbi:WD40 repeat-like protein [Meredithblackwellia eburnea MCA 4105]